MAAGQWILATRPDDGAWTALLWALAVLGALVAWGNQPLTLGGPAPRPRPPRYWALLLSVLATVGAWLGAGNNTYRWWGVLCWVACVGLWLWGWRAEQPAEEHPAVREGRWRWWQLALFIAILLFAAWFRFWQIDTLPQEMTSDHAEKLLDVADVLDGQHPVFFIRNTGREPMQFYLTALLAGPLGLGVSHLALKAGTALIGWVTVPLTYAVARRGLGFSRALSLLAMALLAASKWHVSITRVGLRFPYAPFGVALTLWFFFRALRLGARRDWMLAGAAFGVALHGYTPVRILPLLLVGGAALWLLLEQGRRRTGLAWGEALTNVLLLPLTTLLVFLPVFRYSVENPDMFWTRSTTRVGAVASSELVPRFFSNVWNALLMFHVKGDSVWVNTLMFDPVLDRITGALFVAGAGVALWAALRRLRAVDILLFLALPVLLLPSILALAWPKENPSVVRAGGALPIVMIMAALPLHAWLSALHATLTRPRSARVIRSLSGVAPALLAVGVLAWVAFLNARVYFGPYAEQYLRIGWNNRELAQVMLDHEEQIGGVEHAYVRAWPHWVDTRIVGILTGDPRLNPVIFEIEDVTDLKGSPAEPRLVLLHPKDKASLSVLEYLWDNPTVETFHSSVPGKDFIIVIHPDYADPAISQER